ncbi:hypothetical protein sr10668 [Sporisorium reilianum SRZ2]|uniref:Uncharacterized protein n=1 Tax=Sporisorium reilianum (strain SRZ2) TaxID=999809 RepID=E6ZY56_SPORE|nr:hypothetical protein sr10668 [Sporisorium reilianum SRZ2]
MDDGSSRAAFLEIRITHFKGISADELEPLHQPRNVPLEPALPLLALLNHCRALKEHDQVGCNIKSMQQLFTSEVYRFDGIGDDAALFQHTNREGKAVSMTTIQACSGLAAHAQHVGLPSGSFRSLSHDFAHQMRIFFGADTTRALMVHELHHNTLERHYASTIAMSDLMGLRARERFGGGLEDQLQRSLYFEHELNGLAFRCITMSKKEAAEPKQPTQHAKGKHQPRQELVAEAKARFDTAFTDKLERFDDLARQLCELTTISWDFNQTYHVQKSIVKAIEKLGRQESKGAKELYESAVKVQKEAKVMLRKASHSSGEQKRKGERATETLAITQDEIHAAQAALAINPEVAALPGLDAASDGPLSQPDHPCTVMSRSMLRP